MFSSYYLLFFKISYKTIQFLFPAQWSFTESFQVLTPTTLYTASGQLGNTATLSLQRLPNLPILHVLNLLCCSSRSVIKLINSSSQPSDLLLRPFRYSPLPFSTLSWVSLARQSYSLSPTLTQYPNPQCSQLTILFFKVSYKTIQFLFPHSYPALHCLWPQRYFTESFQILTLPLSTLSLSSLARQLLSHPTPYPIHHVLNLLCCSSRSVIKLFNSSSLSSHLLLRAFRYSLLPLSTLSLTCLARQLLSHPTPYPISESSFFSTYYVAPQDQL